MHCERALELWDGVAEGSRPLGGDRVALLRRAAEAANRGRDIGAPPSSCARRCRWSTRRRAERAGMLYTRLGRFLWAAGEGPDALRAAERARARPLGPAVRRPRACWPARAGADAPGPPGGSVECCREAIAIARGRRAGSRRR